jgi:alpha-tubulin suppressor-like RCC1 family protein
MGLVAFLRDPARIARYLASIGEPTELPGWRAGWVTSSVASETYVVGGLSAPVLEPPPGSYPAAQIVGMRGSLGATIRFTTDGSEPTLTSTRYLTPILVDATATVQARAFRSGVSPSDVSGGTYTIGGSGTVAPAFSPPGGEYTTAQAVVLTTPTPGAAIHYTTDGTEPTATDPSVASGGSVLVDRSLVLKAKAFDGSAESQPARADFLITGAVAAGDNFSLALTADGEILAWGKNDRGQLGDGSTTQRLSPVSVTDGQGGHLDDVTAVSAGYQFGLALRSDGKVWAWGRNEHKQLGQGTSAITQSPTPLEVVGISDVVAIAAGSWHALAVTQDGSVYAWGRNGDGQLGDGSAGASEGTPDLVQGSPTWAGVRAVAAGSRHSFALLMDGTVRGWGANDVGQLGSGATSNDVLSPVPVAELDGVVELTSGERHAQALRTHGEPLGSAWAWGTSFRGQIGDGGFGHRTLPTLATDGIAYVSASNNRSFGSDRLGLVWGWGDNIWWGLATLGQNHQATPVRTLLREIFTISSGPTHGVAVRRNGYVVAWGKQGYGAIGDGTNVDRPYPTEIVQIADNSWLELDDDGDGVSNGIEYVLGTDPLNADSNGNGIDDGVESGVLSASVRDAACDGWLRSLTQGGASHEECAEFGSDESGPGAGALAR